MGKLLVLGLVLFGLGADPAYRAAGNPGVLVLAFGVGLSTLCALLAHAMSLPIRDRLAPRRVGPLAIGPPVRVVAAFAGLIAIDLLTSVPTGPVVLVFAPSYLVFLIMHSIWTTREIKEAAARC